MRYQRSVRLSRVRCSESCSRSRGDRAVVGRATADTARGQPGWRRRVAARAERGIGPRRPLFEHHGGCGRIDACGHGKRARTLDVSDCGLRDRRFACGEGLARDLMRRMVGRERGPLSVAFLDCGGAPLQAFDARPRRGAVHRLLRSMARGVR